MNHYEINYYEMHYPSVVPLCRGRTDGLLWRAGSDSADVSLWASDQFLWLNETGPCWSCWAETFRSSCEARSSFLLVEKTMTDSLGCAGTEVFSSFVLHASTGSLLEELWRWEKEKMTRQFIVKASNTDCDSLSLISLHTDEVCTGSCFDWVSESLSGPAVLCSSSGSSNNLWTTFC